MSETAKQPAGPAAAHWQDVYRSREPDRVSWYEPTPETSLEWIEKAGVRSDAAILDAGGGASALAGELVRHGYSDVTVADISASAIERSQAALGAAAGKIDWVVADLRSHRFQRTYALWHDRAVFHFMVEDEDRDAYLAVLRSAIEPGGHLVLATFGPQGPTQCSGLPVRRYDAARLAALLGPGFRLLDSELADHRTPAGTAQQFLFTHFERLPEPAPPSTVGFSALPRFAAWRHRDARDGFEVVFPREAGDDYRLEGQTVAVEDGEAWSVDYTLDVDRGWATRRARVVGRSARGRREVTLEGDGCGSWELDGEHAPQLEGCLDVDLEASALTNAFPVHRLALEVGQRAEAPAAYVRAPGLAVERLEQGYARVANDGPRRRFAYAAPQFEFRSVLVYDESGLVLDYPGIASRSA